MPRCESSFFPTSGIPATFVQSPLIPLDPAGGTVASLSLSLSLSLPPSSRLTLRPRGRPEEGTSKIGSLSPFACLLGVLSRAICYPIRG